MQTREFSTISSFIFPEPDIVNLDNNSNEPIFPYGFGAQQPIVPPSLNDLNLQTNPFNTSPTEAVVQGNQTQHDDIYSPQPPQPSEPSPISTPAMNLSRTDGRETPHTAVVDNTFYSEDGLKRVHWNPNWTKLFIRKAELTRIYLLLSPSPPLPPRKKRRRLEMEMSFLKRTWMSQHVCEACWQLLPTAKDIPDPSIED